MSPGQLDEIEQMAARLLVATYANPECPVAPEYRSALFAELFVTAEEFYGKRDRWRRSMEAALGHEKTPGR